MNAARPNPDMVFCRACGKEIHNSATTCPNCGAPQSNTDRKILPALILCFFFGWVGAHRFYVGKIWTGILQLITLGGFGVWALIDFILIVLGAFTDKQGNKITAWT